MTRGLAATGHPRVSEAAVAALGAGGNAFDAVVAAGFAATVAEPALTSLGGGGFLLAREASGRATLFDFFSDTPGRGLAAGDLEPHFEPVTVAFPGTEQVFNVGLGSVAVPGTLAGLLHVHERLGRLPLAEVTAPAVALARDGVEKSPLQAYFLELLVPILTMTPAGRAVFAPDGQVLREGERLRNPDLAAFLEALPGAAEDLYAGGLGARIDAEMRAGGGLLTAADLAAFRVVEREPLALAYRGGTLLTNPPPSFGGSLLGLSLERLAARAPAPPETPEGLGALVDVMREVDARRDDEIARIRRFSRGTTHASVADAEGNVASMTTSNGEGSGYVAPGTGIMLNNMMGEDDLHPEGFHASPPGERVASMMSPSVLVEGGRVRLVVGSGGSKRIRTALLQVISLVADHGLSLTAAVEHPRVHWDGAQLQVEPGLPAAALAGLGDLPVNVWSQRDVYFGGVHAVTPGGEAAGDPRRGGAVARAD